MVSGDKSSVIVPLYIYTCRRHKKCGFDPWVRKIPWGQGMATHSSILAWAIPWTEQSIGSQRIGVDWSNLACMCVCVYIYIYIHNSLPTSPWGSPIYDMLLISGCFQEFSITFRFQLITTCLGIISILFILFEVYWASCIYKYIFFTKFRISQ